MGQAWGLLSSPGETQQLAGRLIPAAARRQLRFRLRGDGKA